MHTLPFCTKPSSQTQSNEPKVFTQVEFPGQKAVPSHSSISAVHDSLEKKMHLLIYAITLPMLSECKCLLLTDANTIKLHETIIARAFKGANSIIANEIFWTWTMHLAFIDICSVVRKARLSKVKRKRHTFHILLLLFLLLLPTKFLRTSSIWHRTPTGPSHTWGHVEVSETLENKCWWHFDSYSVWGDVKFVSPMYKYTPMLPFCYGTVYIYGSSLAKPAAFSRTAEQFLCRTYAAPRS